MSRRLLNLCSLLLMLAGLTSLPRLIDDYWLERLGLVYFLFLLCLQLAPLLLTHRGRYGHRLHPINVAYGIFAAVGVLGNLCLALVFLFHGGSLATIIAGSLLFLGVVGSAVLAFFATPWRDWAFRQRESAYLARLERRQS